MTGQWNHKVFGVTGAGFNGLALEIFRFQYAENPVYRAFTDALGVQPDRVSHFTGIPFLPVSLFKTADIRTTTFVPAQVFESSGTTGMVPSRHPVKEISLYEESFLRGFELFYGPVTDWCILALLPSYLERKGSSLVYMADKLVQRCGHPSAGFYLDEFEPLAGVIRELEDKQQKTLLLGVTFALLDFAAQCPMPLRHTVVMETGGMKGRRKEMIRREVHVLLKEAFGVSTVHSEYGMTELLSQAYSKGEGLFQTPPWMKVLARDEEDPLLVKEQGNGILNVIDLANIYSCSFIATDDAGRLHEDGGFEVLGRVDGSDLRGCSLLAV